MVEQRMRIAVTADERRILNGLRDVPPGQARDLLVQVVCRLVEYVREPNCPEMQADGVPCTSPATDCEQCRALKQFLQQLGTQIPR